MYSVIFFEVHHDQRDRLLYSQNMRTEKFQYISTKNKLNLGLQIFR